MNAPRAAAETAATASARESKADAPGKPQSARKHSADAARRHEVLLPGLAKEGAGPKLEVSEEGRFGGQAWRAGLAQLEHRRAIEAELGRAAASSAAFESSGASAQREGARAELKFTCAGCGRAKASVVTKRGHERSCAYLD